MSIMKKIAFVGAPTSGKTTVIEGLEKLYNNECECKLDIIPELGSIFFRDISSQMLERDDVCLRQIRMYRIQLLLEERVSAARAEVPSVMLCDRGIADLLVYLTDEQVKDSFTDSELEVLYKNYDSVYYFDVGGIEDIRSAMSSNPSRIERDAEQIYEMAKKTYAAWAPSPCFHVVRRCESVEEKIKKVALALNNECGCELFKL